MKTITLYVCEPCGQEYETPEEAQQCESRPVDPIRYAVGDIVLQAHRFTFGWFDGDRAWVENNDDVDRTEGKCIERFCRKCCYRFYYVVTAIDRDEKDPHRVRYHLATKAMSESTHYRTGYTFNSGHIETVKVPRPPAAVVSGSLALHGLKAKRLLI